MDPSRPQRIDPSRRSGAGPRSRSERGPLLSRFAASAQGLRMEWHGPLVPGLGRHDDVVKKRLADVTRMSRKRRSVRSASQAAMRQSTASCPGPASTAPTFRGTDSSIRRVSDSTGRLRCTGVPPSCFRPTDRWHRSGPSAGRTSDTGRTPRRRVSSARTCRPLRTVAVFQSAQGASVAQSASTLGPTKIRALQVPMAPAPCVIRTERDRRDSSRPNLEPPRPPRGHPVTPPYAAAC
jgi:hypothetical protein